MNLETQLKQMEKKLLKEIADLRKLIVGRNINGTWVLQKDACEMINVSPRQLRNIRIHLDNGGKAVGFVRWKKGKGKAIQYHKADLEKYLETVTIT
jgi:hypothetical protein